MVLKLRGAFKKNPQREAERAGEPVVDEPAGDPPSYFNEALCARWEELIDWCPWVRRPDRVLLEVACRIWQRLIDNQGKASDEGLLITALSRMGMTPTERTRVKVPGTGKQKPKNAFKELA